MANNAERQPDIGQLHVLKNLLVGREQDRLSQLEDRFSDPDWLAAALPEHLPAAFRKDPEKVADALYPILGPAIRRSIQNALATTVETVNRSVEHSFSKQGLLWRFEAWRTGTSFGEIVLRNSLVFRIEQVFLIHRETSLPILHVVDPNIAGQDSSLVAGMLSAIQDFVKDSFKVAEGDGLDSVQVGGLTVLLEDGPDAVLATVVRGTPPEHLRTQMAEALEGLHGGPMAQALADFDGDSDPLESYRPVLAGLLETRLQPSSGGIPRQVVFFWIALGLLALGLFGNSILQSHRWSKFRQLADGQPGVLITSVERSLLGKPVVTGLRDPLSGVPGGMLKEAGLDPEQVTVRWGAFISLEEEMILARVRSRIRPPATVSLAFYAGKVEMTGYAPIAWRKTADALALMVPGVSSVTNATHSNYNPSPDDL